MKPSGWGRTGGKLVLQTRPLCLFLHVLKRDLNLGSIWVLDLVSEGPEMNQQVAAGTGRENRGAWPQGALESGLGCSKCKQDQRNPLEDKCRPWWAFILFLPFGSEQ